MSSPTTDVRHVVISAEKLRQKIAAGRDVVILEVRRDAGDHDAVERVPGAHAVSLTTDLVGVPSAGAGNLPLPTEELLQQQVRRWGINPDSIVVAYSPENPALAARAWWTLKWAGVPDVRVLDGGVDEWAAAGGELTSAVSADGAGTFEVKTGALPTLDAEEAAALARSGVLLDARADAAFTGGHIPGAVSLPGVRLTRDGGQLFGDDELRALYGAAGADGRKPIGAYCGGGTSAGGHRQHTGLTIR